MKAAVKAMDSIVIERLLLPRKYIRQHLCLDKGYDFPEIEREVLKRSYVPHIRHKGKEKRINKHEKTRRWMVERTNYGITDSKSCLLGTKRNLRTT
jgi:putative transposase